MTLPPIESATSDTQQRKHRAFLFVFAGVVLLVGLCGVYILGFVPSFARFPVDLPEDDYGPGDWTSDSYSIVELQGGRVFEARLDGIVWYAGASEYSHLDRLREYFEAAGAHLEWELGKTTEICDSYLPEASLLVDNGHGDLLQFQEKNKPVYMTGAYQGDLACVAILPTDVVHSQGDEVFNIAILTVRQSPLMAFFEYLGGL